jgi:hypothetical protein
MNRNYSAKIDAGINRLHRRRLPGQTFTLREIAKECGCDQNAIFLREITALRHAFGLIQKTEMKKYRDWLL